MPAVLALGLDPAVVDSKSMAGLVLMSFAPSSTLRLSAHRDSTRTWAGRSAFASGRSITAETRCS
jgi:hypothetical protein